VKKFEPSDWSLASELVPTRLSCERRFSYQTFSRRGYLLFDAILLFRPLELMSMPGTSLAGVTCNPRGWQGRASGGDQGCPARQRFLVS
jgi:hypothetical protein